MDFRKFNEEKEITERLSVGMPDGKVLSGFREAFFSGCWVAAEPDGSGSGLDGSDSAGARRSSANGEPRHVSCDQDAFRRLGLE